MLENATKCMSLYCDCWVTLHDLRFIVEAINYLQKGKGGGIVVMSLVPSVMILLNYMLA